MSRRPYRRALSSATAAAALTAGALVGLATPAQAATVTYFVASGVMNGPDCSATLPCANLLDAAIKVNNGDANGQDVTINIGPGVFTGAAGFGGAPASLTLNGAGRSSTSLMGTNTGDGFSTALWLFGAPSPYPVTVQRLSISTATPPDPTVPNESEQGAYGIYSEGARVLTVTDVRIGGIHGGLGYTAPPATTGASGGNGGPGMGILQLHPDGDLRLTRTEITDVTGGPGGDATAAGLGNNGEAGGGGGDAFGAYTHGAKLTVSASSVNGIKGGDGGDGAAGGATEPGGGVAGDGGGGGAAGSAAGFVMANDSAGPGLATLTDSTATAVSAGLGGTGGRGGNGLLAEPNGGENGGTGGNGGPTLGAAGIAGIAQSQPLTLVGRHLTVSKVGPGAPGAGGAGGIKAAAPTATDGMPGQAGSTFPVTAGIVVAQSPGPAAVLQLAANLLDNPASAGCGRLDSNSDASLPVAAVDGGYSVASDGSCFNGGSGNVTNPTLGGGLAALADNGGPTRTIALLGNTNIAASAVPAASGLCAGTDQRGVARPNGGSAKCAAGAYQPTTLATCKGKLATIQGTNGRDKLIGTPGRDIIAGLGGRDVIRGLGGNDLICGGRGKDRLLGGWGRDSLRGDGGEDVLLGGKGRDILNGGPGNDVLIGGPGKDRGGGGKGKDKLRAIEGRA